MLKESLKIRIISFLILNAIFVSLYGQGAPNIAWTISGHSTTVHSVCFSQNGQKAISGGGTEAKIWQVSDGTLLQNVSGFSSNLLDVCISPDDSLLSAGYVIGTYPPGGVMDVVKLSQGTILYNYGGCYVEFSPDGSLIASGGGGVNRNLYLHRISDGVQIGSFYNGYGYITDFTFSPDGQMVAVATTTNEINLWDIASGTILRTFTGHTDDVSTVDFSPDGQMLASGAGGYDNPGEATIKLWNVSDGSVIRTLTGHIAWVIDVSFSPDGQTLISCGRDGISPNIYPNIKIWNVSDGSLLQYYDQELSNAATSVEYSPDGQTFFYGRSDGKITMAHSPFVTGITKNSEFIPDKIKLHQNFPNPFNPVTTIQYELPATEKVSLKIFNIVGNEIRILVNKIQSKGTKSVIWDGSDNYGRLVSSGVYFYRIQTGNFTETRKMTLLY